MKTAIVVPWRDTNPHRRRNIDHVLRQLGAMVPDEKVAIAVDSNRGAGPFNRAASRNLGVRTAVEWGADCVVVCDADTVPQGDPLRDAISQAHDGVLHLPYTRYRALTEAGTQRYIDGTEPSACEAELDWEASTGGVFVMHPDAWSAAGGMDERFTAWGYEDTSFRIACDALLGPSVRHPGLIVHLWHPLATDRGTAEQAAGYELARRYDAAEGRGDAVRELLAQRPQGGAPISEKPRNTP